MKRNKKIRITTFKFFLRKRVVAFFLLIAFLSILIMMYMWFFVTPILVDTGQAKISELANVSMNDAVSNVMKGTVTYDDLIHIVTDNNGKISMLQANSIQINELSRDIIECTYETLFDELDKPLKIPIGSFTGIPIFSSLGPVLNVNILPYGNVICNFLSKFISAGINQTHHKIYVNIVTKVNVVLPLSKLYVESASEVLVCESLIIGEVPETYLMAEQTGDLLNLIN